VDATWTLATASGPGAIAVVQLAGDIDGALAACGIRPVPVGGVAVRDLMGVDRGVVARWTGESCQLMPHAGAAVVRLVLEGLGARGIVERREPDPRWMYPEARSEVEARALAAVSRAASPLAVDLLLAQHELWARPGALNDPGRDRVLARLIDPPLVVAVGASNIGKSTLANALAGRGVSIVADEPGTTRDHVGVMLDLGGLVVRYVDTPGLREGAGEVEREAVEAAMELAGRADLLLACGDHTSPPPGVLAGVERITVGLREDLGEPKFSAEVRVSAARGAGVAALAAAVRERLVPEAMMGREQAWKFWS
jgi:hypothetical protein